MSVDQSKAIDFLGVDKRSGKAILTISDHLGWSNSLEHQLILQEKINTYLLFVESGEMVERFPHVANLPVVIDVRFMYSPDDSGLQFLARAREVIESAGFSLEYKKLGSDLIH